MKEAGLSRLPVRLNTIDRVKNDPELSHLYDGKYEVPFQYDLVPKEQAHRSIYSGSAIKSFYSKKHTNPNPKNPNSFWVGKVGDSKSHGLELTSQHSQNDVRVYHKRDMNEEVIKEKIGCDAYRLFGDGLFATPKTRLSEQPLKDDYTQDNYLAGVYFDELSINQSLRVMSKWVTGYRDLKDIKVPDIDGNPILFMDYIKKHNRPSEVVIDPESSETVPIYGLMAVLAAATSLADIDVLGISGANCGLIFIRNSNGTVYEALVVKIDPGYVFSYTAANEIKFPDPRDIRYATQGDRIHWSSLTNEQKEEFLEVKRHNVKLNQEEILHYLFYREGLWRNSVFNPMKKIVILNYENDLKLHLEQQAIIYQKDLEEYEKTRETTIQEKAKKAFDKGNYDRAFNYYEKRVEIQEKKEEGTQETLAESYNNLGMVYKAQGQFDRAIEYLEKALAIQLVSLGEKHPSVATSYNNLGEVYRNQGQFDRAIKYYEKALAIRLVSLGKKHPNVAISYNNLGLVYDSQGQFDRAVEYFEKALAIQLVSLGEKHPSLATSYNNLGMVYKAQGQFDRAIEYLEKALAIDLVSLGEKHPDVAISYNNLGLVYKAQGQFDRAIEYYEKALAIDFVSLGEKHPDVATSYYNLGGVYYSQGQFDRAIEYLEKASAIYLMSLGEKHPNVATSYNNLGGVYYSQGQFDRAIEYYEKALAIRLDSLGDKHPDVATSYNNLNEAIKSRNKSFGRIIDELTQILRLERKDVSNGILIAQALVDMANISHSQENARWQLEENINGTIDFEFRLNYQEETLWKKYYMENFPDLIKAGKRIDAKCLKVRVNTDILTNQVAPKLAEFREEQQSRQVCRIM